MPYSAPPVGDPAQPTTTVDPPWTWYERDRVRDKWKSRDDERVLGPRVWFSAEYLGWFVKSASAPPLAQAVLGVQPGDNSFAASQVYNLSPDGDLDYRTLSGIRGTIGFWLNTQQTVGFEGSYSWFGKTTQTDVFYSLPGVIIGRPFIDAQSGQNTLYQVSGLDGTVGTIAVQNAVHLEGGEANLLFNSMAFGPRWNFIAGFRYLEVAESLTIGQSAAGPDGFMRSFDDFSTRNQFFGGQVGIRWAYQGDRLFASLTGKIGFGAVQQRAIVNGGAIWESASDTAAAPGGVLALPSNMGAYNRTRTAFLPEAIATVGFRLTRHSAVSVGYNFLYLTELARPSGQIDPIVDQRNLPFAGGAATSLSPQFRFRGESFWAQGLNFGVSFQY